MAIWSILLRFGIFCGFYGHLVYFFRFGILLEEKSGNPDPKRADKKLIPDCQLGKSF
jgi:hypothetical protein